MSIALDNNRRMDMKSSGIMRGLVFDSPVEGRIAGAGDSDTVKESNACNNETSSASASASASASSSSIGKNSDLSVRSSSDGDDCEENEAQSSYKGPLEMMEALEEVLPIRRGISKFYNGKSKSFTSLGDAASTSSIKDITKPENAYTRKRRNLMAFNHVWDNKNRSFPLRSNGGGISKRPISSSRSSLALAMAMSSSESSSSTSDDSSSRSPPPLPPLHPQARASFHVKSSTSPPRHFCASRSLSLADLQQ
ncbi:hypothetical protein L484_018609 [Morus notabilis]|uniref:MTD1 n=1 Tax=Morus notabilis TaxID=981085 RepID=W9RF79_9ROSA|nr:vitellogenin-2 [Morus notabilis]EXB74901.1 hypothetical protein L484_018609 [Morus notabilis]